MSEQDIQATNERTFDDALLHLRKADALLNLVFEGRMDMFSRDRTFHQAHDHVVKAWNTVAYLNEQITEIRSELRKESND